MQLTLSTENPDVPKHKCLTLGIFTDEKPPRGMCGFIDWRLNGMVSREIKGGIISGVFEEKIIIPSPGRIGAEMLLLLGLGRTSDIDYDKIYNAAYLAAKTVDGIAMKSFAFDLYGEGRNGLVVSGIVEAMVTGIFDFLSSDIEKLGSMSVCAVTAPKNLQDVSRGIERFKKNVNDRGAVEICAMDNAFALT